MGTTQGRDIAIIGGGIGGLTAALAFARHNAKVTVYEQAPALTEVGAGLQITPNGARALNALGIHNDLAAAGVTAQAVVPMDVVASREITRFDLTGQTPPYRFYHRAALIDILARACEAAGVTVKLGARIADLNADGSFTAGGEVIRPAMTIGADGLHSVVRGLINKPAKPFFTGQVAWRAVIKSDKADPVARIWMAPGRHMVTYPLSGGRLNIVAVQERSQWADEGWNHADDPGNLRMAFADCGWEVKSILGEVEQVNLWGLFRHPVAEKWHAGSVAILGDAAHPTLPFLAQGANLAIEDAYVLARSCDEAASLDAGLQDYQSKRRARVVRAIEAANKNAKNYHLSGVQRSVAHTGLRVMGKFAPSAFLNRLGWLYDHDVTA
ncbi:FAD-dependent monooxygenase [Yoonia sp. F2084L]|uniref:FAD-dependent monooxygenase n=1 Tax=Yoonia sp. F2084L TaxID=2926419 RepID=UPI001FF5E49D|nr:FAD-dependent monooxygenase [Yoonia sp. F2084L]MCK0094290.1 FAD-dependent monooxygenase [Yoonia sp. F2084L]